MVHNLRNYLGDDLFRSGGQAVLAANYGGALDDVMLEAAWEEATGVDLTPWFDAHIRQPGFSTWVLDSAITAQPGEVPGYVTTLHLQQKLRACENHHDNEPLDVTVWDLAGQREVAQIVVGGQYATAEIVTDLQPAMVALNAEGRLNQGRMDLDYWISETSSLQNLPWVDLRIGCDEIVEGDSALVRVEHHWAGADGAPGETLAEKAPYVEEISGTHFWTIDGLWPEDLLLDARFTYRGGDEDELDLTSTGTRRRTPSSLGVRPRPTRGSSIPTTTLQMGSAFNGGGCSRCRSCAADNTPLPMATSPSGWRPSTLRPPRPSGSSQSRPGCRAGGAGQRPSSACPFRMRPAGKSIGPAACSRAPSRWM